MSEEKANITVNLKEGSFSISGSEMFVNKNKQDILDFLTKNKIADTGPTLTPTSVSCKKEKVTALPNNDLSSDKYIAAGIYNIDTETGDVHISAKIPGSKKSEKCRNIALIVLHAKGDTISGKTIKPLCELQSCYDSANFANFFKKDIENFIKKGSGQTWTLALTVDGKAAAIALLEEMLNAKK